MHTSSSQRSTRILNVGLLGCGTIARQVYLRLLRSVTHVRLTAVADPDPARLAAAQREHPDAVRYADGHALLAHHGLDAVILAVPSHLHADLAVAAFERGLHVYVEKPLAATLADGERMVRAWRAAGTVGAIGFNCRFTPLYGRLRALVRAGRAGPPVCVRTVFATAPHAVPAWKRKRESGGGVLLDLASHHVDLVRFIFDREVERARATILSRHTEADTALLELVLRDGPLVQSFFSLAAAEQDRVEVFGERARLSVSRFTSLDVEIADNPSGAAGAARALVRRASALRRLPAAWKVRRAPLRDPGYAEALASFVAAARGGQQNGDLVPDLLDGVRCLAVIDAAEQSARSGLEVTLPSPPIPTWA